MDPVVAGRWVAAGAAGWVLTFLSLTGWGLGGCASTRPAVTAKPSLAPLPQTDPRDKAVLDSGRVWAPAVHSLALFDRFSEGVAGERFLKFLVDLKTDKIYYFDVHAFEMHTDFVFRHLYRREPSPDDLAAFLANYDEDKPSFLLCYLVHHLDQDLWTFAFYQGDRARPEAVQHAYRRLRETFVAGDRVRYRPDSEHQEEVAKRLVGVPVITNDEIYKRSTYQPFSVGKATGVLHIFREGELQPGATTALFRPDEIVILAAPIPDLTPVAGIISESFSTPLSHVSLRARAWGIPHIGLKNAATRYASLEGQTVVLDARPDGYTLRPADPAEVAAWKEASKHHAKVRVPPANLKERRLRALGEVRAAEVDAYGAKCANLSEIARAKLPGFQIPPGFGIPIAYYAEHLRAHGLDAEVRALLEDPMVAQDPATRRARLAALRHAIVHAPMVPATRAALVKRAQALGAASVFVRSSTNAEDLPGFNGAGLYDTVPNVPVPAADAGAEAGDALEAAVKRVWASVWNLRAFDERTFYGIDHHAVYGAVLVEVGVNATAAGVLITTNTFDPRQTDTYTINAKSGLGIRVVDGHAIPEQLLVDVDNGQIRVLSRSDERTMLVFDPKGGVREVPVPGADGDGGAPEPVLTPARARRLVAAAQAIVGLFPDQAPLDIEWLFQGDALHIVQARPYITGLKPVTISAPTP